MSMLAEMRASMAVWRASRPSPVMAETATQPVRGTTWLAPPSRSALLRTSMVRVGQA